MSGQERHNRPGAYSNYSKGFGFVEMADGTVGAPPAAAGRFEEWGYPDLVEMDIREPGFGTETSVLDARQTVAAEFASYLGLTSGYDQGESLGLVEDGVWLGDDRPTYEGYPEEER